MNKIQNKLMEIVLFMAGMVIYQSNIFGLNDARELNRKIGELLAIVQDRDINNEK